MKRRDIVVGIVILAVVAFILIRSRQDTTPTLDPTPTSSIEGTIEQLFNTSIPDDIEKAELTDISGGTGSAIATRDITENKSSFEILADLEDPTGNEFYQGWIARGDGEIDELLSLGRFRQAKGGWVVELIVSQDLSGFDTVLVTQESILDTNPEISVLQGSF